VKTSDISEKGKARPSNAVCVADCNADVRLLDVTVVTVELSEYRQVIMLICLSTVKEVCRYIIKVFQERNKM
jgi:hypothetical protein